MTNISKFGRILLAIPMLVYPPLHFIYSSFVATIVPPWIPWHLFWTYFTAIAIFVAGLAILFRIYAYWAAILLGLEIFLFVVLIHGPLLFHNPHDTWAGSAMFGDMPGRLINSFKDLGLCGAVLVFAGTQSKSWKSTGADNVFIKGRLILGISLIAFGILHFIYPMFAPGIPPMLANVTFTIRGGPSWVYLTSLVLFMGGIMILTGEKARLLVVGIGAILLLFDLLVWVPRFGANHGDIYGNWLKDIGIIGGIFILADTLPEASSKSKVFSRKAEG